MRTISLVTTSRADYNFTIPLMRALTASPELQPRLLVGGMHLNAEFGLTVRQIEADGFPIGARIEMLLGTDTPSGIAKSMGLGVIGFAQEFATVRPDILVVQGDRFEMHSAAVAALPYNIPVAHLGGGDVTEGAIDECIRHSMSKLSHLHFVSIEEHAERLRSMGEEPWRVFVTGATALDLIRTAKRLPAEELRARWGIPAGSPFLLVSYHPVTLEYADTERQVGELLAALDAVGLPVVFTAPNADTQGHVIAPLMKKYISAHPESRFVESLGPAGYSSAMSMATAMVGNSSSGIIEAASFKLPVVNVGTRQGGRMSTINVIHCGYGRGEILEAIRKATTPAFHNTLADLINPYGDGFAIPRIVKQLESIPLNDKLLRKKFHNPKQEIKPRI